MGLAASQARLLTITARLADNELRSQTINNAKMRLATQSSQASEDYVNALNNARLMFTNTDMNGLSQTQVLNFNNLTAYSPYNTQYGLVNSAGLALVSETEAKLFKEANGNLNTYLQAHGLEWETTYFDEKYDEYGNELNNIQAKLQSFYGGDIGLDYLFDDLDYNPDNGKQATNADFKALYEMYDANQLSIERTSYNGLAQEYYNQLKSLYKTTIPLFRNDVLGENKSENDIISSILAISGVNAAIIKDEVKNLGHGSDLKMGFESAKVYLTDDKGEVEGGKTKVRKLIDSLMDFPGGTSGYLSGTEKLEMKKVGDNYVWTFGNIKITGSTDATDTSGSFTIERYKEDSRTYKYNGTELPTTANNTTIADIINGITHESGFYRYTSGANTVDVYTIGVSEDIYKAVLSEYFAALFDTQGYFEPVDYASAHKGEGIKGLEKFEEIYDKFTTIYGIDVGNDAELLIDFQALMQSEIEDISGKTGKAGLLGTEEFHNVVDAYKIDLMVDVLGEPKYTWIDEADKTNTGNAETKAQWYTNLFKRMEQGYRILEDGLASSSKWLEYAFESGLVGLEQVDKTYNWNALSYSSCSSISEESDSSEAVAIAEAKYRRAMNDIEQKDKMYDLQLKNIDTEHNSLQTEYDSIKTVIQKNIERTMKFDQSA